MPVRPLTQPVRLASAAAVALAIGTTAAAHLRFLALDGRPPRDLCNCQRALPEVARSLETSLPAGLQDAAGVLLTPTGWYSMLRLGAVELVGRAPETLQAFDLFGVLGVILGTAWLAWRLVGPGAAGPAALLVASMPALVVEGRQGWIHIPEAALVLAAMAAWTADPGLDRRRTVASMGILGGLAILLRPSGLVWVATLLPLLWRRPVRRVAVVLGLWGIAAIVPLLALPEYLAAKAEARDRYATVIPDLWPQFLVLLGPGASTVVLVGLGIAALRRPAGLRIPAAWTAIALLLAVVFRAGLDNHTLLLAGLAILAGAGLAWFPRLGVGVAGLVFVFQTGPQWLPPPAQDSIWWRTPGAWRIQVAPSILNYYVPFPRYGVAEVRGLLDAICGDKPCTVVADQGLYLPYGEEPGLYELFAAGEARPKLRAVHDLTAEKAPRVDALVEFDCPDQDRAWQVRWPEAKATRDALIRRQHLEVVWGTEAGPGCMVRWRTPDRFVAHPERLPPER